MNDIYEVHIFGEFILTTVSVINSGVTTWIKEVKKQYRHPRHIVGFGIMSHPTETNPIDTIHICVGHHCLIYRMYRGFVPHSLDEFLSDPENFFVGVDIKSDLEKLQTQYGIGGNAYYVVLGDVAADEYDRPELRNAGLTELAKVVMGGDIEKPRLETMIDWADDEGLTSEQVLYGTIDPFVSSEIGKTLGVADRVPGQI